MPLLVPLQWSVVSPTTSSILQAAGQTKAEPGGWIDAHSHIWTADTSRFKLRDGVKVEDLAPRSFTDEELMAIAGPEGVERVVLIQHYPYHGWDNSYLIDAWTRHPARFRIVGMIDDQRSDTDQSDARPAEEGRHRVSNRAESRRGRLSEFSRHETDVEDQRRNSTAYVLSDQSGRPVCG